jgi:hypothetical protein
MEKKNKRNDQVKVKTKWRCPTEVIKKANQRNTRREKKDIITVILSL